MKLAKLAAVPPWEWPDGTDAKLLGVLQDDQATEEDRLLAAEMAGEISVTNDAIVEALLSTIGNEARSDGVRARAAISLGPVLEEADLEGFEGDGDPPISERTFARVQQTLRALFRDEGQPMEVRRRILEVSVRAPQDWHAEAIRTAYGRPEADWKLTAVFCMRFVDGFEQAIVEALDSPDLEVRREAVLAAGSWEVEAAWQRVQSLVTSAQTEKPLLLAAIEAAMALRPREAGALLEDLRDSEDEEIVDAVEEALAMGGAVSDES